MPRWHGHRCFHPNDIPHFHVGQMPKSGHGADGLLANCHGASIQSRAACLIIDK
jgi:pantothenate kinase type III